MMKCANCPLFSWWNNESDKGESCGLFGDSWDSAFQYEDKDGNIVGCYIDRHYIEQTDERYMKHLEECVERFKAAEANQSGISYSDHTNYTGAKDYLDSIIIEAEGDDG